VFIQRIFTLLPYHATNWVRWDSIVYGTHSEIRTYVKTNNNESAWRIRFFSDGLETPTLRRKIVMIFEEFKHEPWKKQMGSYFNFCLAKAKFEDLLLQKNLVGQTKANFEHFFVTTSTNLLEICFFSGFSCARNTLFETDKNGRKNGWSVPIQTIFLNLFFYVIEPVKFWCNN
jgi:hypothetical protein